MLTFQRPWLSLALLEPYYANKLNLKERKEEAMPTKKEIALMAHLMRRAGFGASYEELEARAKKGYEATVEELIDPDSHGVPRYDDLTLARYYPDMEVPSAPAMGTSNFMYHL